MTAPKHWEVFPLNALVDVLDNLRVPVNSTERSKRPGAVPYYGATGQVGTIDKAIFNEDLLVLGEDGVQFFDQNKPKAYKISGPAWVNNHAHVLRPKQNRVLQDFLLHFLNQFNYIGYANGTTRLKLTQGAMNSIPVPLPSVAEQHKIVELLEDHLSRLDDALEDVRQVKMKASQFRRSLLQSTFAENVDINLIRSVSIAFDDAFEIGKTARKALKQRDYLREGEFPVIDQGEDFISGYSNDDSLVLDFKKPAIIFGDHTRRIKYVNFPFIAGADGTKILLPDVALDSVFACFQLQSKELRDKGYSRHFSELRKEKFWTPPISDQLKIVEHLEEHFSRIDTSSSIVDSMEKQAAALRRSLLQAAFTGQLTKEVVNV